MEDGEPVENTDLATDLGATTATEYPYDGRGFRVVQTQSSKAARP